MIDLVATENSKISLDSAYTPTLQLIWNDLKKYIIKSDIKFDEYNENVNNLNKESFNETMINENYYYKVYGLKTLELKKEIEKNIKEKFNTKSDILDHINWMDHANNYFLYSMIYRAFEFKYKFDLLGNGKFKDYDNVKYFGIKHNDKLRKQIKVLFYESNTSFALKIYTKDNDEIIFYKNPEGETFKEMYSNLKNKTNESIFRENDYFKAPLLKINTIKEYNDLCGKIIKSSTNEFMIEKAIQTVNFELNEKGGKIKSEAALDVKVMCYMPEKPRNFFIDDTFALFIKEKDKEVPYFSAYINDITKYQ